ncbi:uncharacterized [Tachysurus ichikawai]
MSVSKPANQNLTFVGCVRTDPARIVLRCVCTSTSQGFLRQDFLTGPKPIRFVSVRPPAKQLECRIMEKQQDCSPTPQNPSRQRAVGVVMRFSGAASLVVDADVYHMHLCGT